MPLKFQAYFNLAMAMFLCGSSIVVSKIITAEFPVFLASGLRFGIAFLILLPWFLKQNGMRLNLNWREFVILFLQSLSGVFLFSIFLLYGLRYTSAAEGGIIMSSTPAVIALGSIFFFKERLKVHSGVGIGLAVVGLLFLNATEGSAEAGSNALLGNLLIFGAVVGEALFTLLRKCSSSQITPLFSATAMSFLGFVLFLPLGLIEAWDFPFASVSLGGTLSIIYSAVAVTVIAFVLWFRGVSQVPATTSAAFTGVMPVCAVVLSYGMLNEPFQWAHLAGGLCVLAGLAAIIYEPQKKKPLQPPAERTLEWSMLQTKE